jgi:hypothetical protein
MDPEAELHALLLKLRDVEQRAEMHRERAKALEREAAELRASVRRIVTRALAENHSIA